MYCKKFVKKKQMNTKLTVKIYASFNTDFYRSEKNQLLRQSIYQNSKIFWKTIDQLRRIKKKILKKVPLFYICH